MMPGSYKPSDAEGSTVQDGPVVAEQLYELVTRRLAEKILGGGYEPGDKMPSERELMGAFGVGRSTVREALVSLASLGVLDICQGRGIYVRRLPFDSLVQRLTRPAHAYSLASIWETRIVVESAAAQFAASRRSERDLSELETSVAGMAEEIQAGGTGLADDSLFHLRVLRASQNPVLVHLGEELGAMSVRARRAALMKRGRPASSHREHARILKAIAEQNSSAAARAMRLHLAFGLKITTHEEDGVLPEQLPCGGSRKRNRAGDQTQDVED